MKKINIGLIGYGNWGKKIYLNLKFFPNLRFFIFKKKIVKKKNKFLQFKKVDQLKKYKLNAIISASNSILHSKLCIYCLKNKIPAFIEKPLTKDMNFFKKIKKIKNFKKNILHINYIYLKYLNYLKISKKKKIKKIILITGSISNNNNYNYNLWDWVPHCLSILSYFYSLNIKKINIKKRFQNFILRCEFKDNITALCFYGNNFKKSRKILKIFYDNSNAEYIQFDKNFPLKATPLYNSLNVFFNHIKKKKSDIEDVYLSEKITKIISKLEK